MITSNKYGWRMDCKECESILAQGERSDPRKWHETLMNEVASHIDKCKRLFTPSNEALRDFYFKRCFEDIKRRNHENKM
jgi:hypothetical protein